jgi:dihydroflavonol-4-reductase
MGLDVENCTGDLADTAVLAKQMSGCNVVFHTAAYVAVENIDIPLMKKINVDGTKAMCKAALETRVQRFIHFSSIHAFQQQPTSDTLTEDRPLVQDSKASPYDRTKAAAQRHVLDAYNQGLNASILHPTGIIGPYDFKPSRMGQVISDIADQKMSITINSGFNWVDVRDVCNTAINCIEKGKSGQHYIVPGEWASLEQIAEIIAGLIGKRTIYMTLPFWTAYTAIPFAYLRAKLTGQRPSFSRGSLHALSVQCKDIPGTLARQEIGHQSRPLESTIKDTIDWLIKNGKIA